MYHMYQSIGCLPCVLRNNTDQYGVVKQTNKQKKHPTLHIVYRNSTPGLPHDHQTLVVTRVHASPTLMAKWGSTSVARLAAPLEE